MRSARRPRRAFVLAAAVASAVAVVVLVVVIAVIAFDGGRARGSTPARVATVGVLGDLIFQGDVQRQSFAARDGARTLLTGIEPMIEATDVTYANFEGVASCCQDVDGKERRNPGRRFDGIVYSSRTSRGLNTAPTFVLDLARAGIDVMSTANNHALDRGRFGAVATLDAMDAAGVAHTGTRRTPDEPWHTVVDANGLLVAFLACTEWTNGPDDDADHVLYCYAARDEVLRVVRELAADPLIDAVLVTPHAGRGEQAKPDKRFRTFARELVDAGATAVLGNGRHIVQPSEHYTTVDGRSTLLVYSIGNVFADKPAPVDRTSVYLELTLAAHEVLDVRWAPLVFPDAPAPRSVSVTEPEDGLVPLPPSARMKAQAAR